MKARTGDDLNKFLFRSRLRITLIGSGEPARFEGEFLSIVDDNKLPKLCSHLIGIELSKDADSSFGLWKNCVIFFDPCTREWTGYAKEEEETRKFMIEVIGLIYNYRDYFDSVTWCSESILHDDPTSSEYDHHIEMDRFRIAISGYNIRAILFKKIFNGLWKDSPYKKSSIQEVKGKNLIVLLYALKDRHDFFTEDEMKVVNMYLHQDSLLNP